MRSTCQTGIGAFVFAILSICSGQTLRITAVQNEASRDTRLCPGCRAVIFASVNRATITIGGTAVRENYHGSSSALGNYIGVSIPAHLPPGPSTVSLSSGDTSARFNINLDNFAPALYTLDGSGGGRGYFRRQPLSSLDPGIGNLFAGLFRAYGDYPDLVVQDTGRRAIPGEILVAYAAGLGPTSPPVTTGFTRSAPLSNTVSLAIDGRPADVLWAGNSYSGGLVGRVWDCADLYSVRFRVPNDLSEGNHTVAIQIGSQASNSVALPVGRTVPVITGLFNAASFADEGWAAPGSIMTLYGENLEGVDDLSAFPATGSQGIAVAFDGSRAPLIHVMPSRGQINLVTPADLRENKQCWPDGEQCVIVQLNGPGGVSPKYYLSTNAVQPGIFLIGDPGQPTRRNAAALFSNTAWRVMSRSQAQALKIPYECKAVAANAICGQPARRGDVVQIYCTGLGRATPEGDASGLPLPTGSVAPPDGRPLYLTVSKPEVTIGGFSTEVLFSGLAPGFAGLYQVNIRIPAAAPAGDEVPIIIRQTYYSDSATLAIER